ncbi:MAG: hypothetical protein A2252_07065 [Elusimicrobia bacterium RIFOXYA2_FULL_39_19]|nr:MAG: hypothetical protein A2252_07065 [Elusimicrobia bacterium RIFOXYA2_FULL_39_19]
MLFSFILLFLLLLAAGYLAGLYNRLVFLKNNYLRAWANIDVLLKQRHDEIPKLVSTCEGYMKFEKNILENISALRAQAMGAKSVGDKVRVEQQLTGALAGLYAVVENYPDLKTSEQFMNLQKRITYLENQIADRREFYNDSAAIYNTIIDQIPYTFFAASFNFTRQELFKVTAEDKKDVSIKFNA